MYSCSIIQLLYTRLFENGFRFKCIYISIYCNVHSRIYAILCMADCITAIAIYTSPLYCANLLFNSAVTVPYIIGISVCAMCIRKRNRWRWPQFIALFLQYQCRIQSILIKGSVCVCVCVQLESNFFNFEKPK